MFPLRSQGLAPENIWIFAWGRSPCNAKHYLSRFFPGVAGDGMNTVSFIARRPEGVRSWELHHENRREVLFLEIYVRRLKSIILNGLWRGRGEVGWGRLKSTESRGSIWGICWTSWWIWKLRLCQNWDLFMLYRSIWVSGADLIYIID